MSLPKKWFIIRNKSNYQEINKWNNSKPQNSDNAFLDSTATFGLDFDYQTSNLSEKYLNLGYTEITFEQFKTHILKEETIYKIY